MKISYFLAFCCFLSATTQAALIVNQSSAWPSAPIVAGASNTQATTERDVRFTRDFSQSFQVTDSFVLGKAFIEYREGIADKELTLKIFKTSNVNATGPSSMPIQVGLDLLSISFMTTSGTLETGTTQTVMEFQFSEEHQITLEPLTGTEGYVFQLLRTGVGSDLDSSDQRALKWTRGDNVYLNGRMFERGISYSSDLSLAFEAAAVIPEPSTLLTLGTSALGLALFVRRRGKNAVGC